MLRDEFSSGRNIGIMFSANRFQRKRKFPQTVAGDIFTKVFKLPNSKINITIENQGSVTLVKFRNFGGTHYCVFNVINITDLFENKDLILEECKKCDDAIESKQQYLDVSDDDDDNAVTLGMSNLHKTYKKKKDRKKEKINELKSSSAAQN